jgi:hypothetical protein
VSPSPPPSSAHLLGGCGQRSSNSTSDNSGSDESTSPFYRDVQRLNAEYSTVSTTVSHDPVSGSYSNPCSSSSLVNVSGDNISLCPRFAVNCLPGVTPSVSAFSEAASDSAAVPPLEGNRNGAFSTLALLQRFLEERQRIAVANSSEDHNSNGSDTHAGKTPSKLSHASASGGSQVFDALRIAHLVPSVVPATAAAEANAEAAVAVTPDHGFYLVESSYMRAATITAIVKRQKAERHAAYSAAHPFFHSPTPLADVPAAVRPTRLPTVLDMPVHLRCPMCQRHDAMCNRCHHRWSQLQDSYRDEAAVRCYSTLDVKRRGALSLLTAALGTGSFLEMMSIADGLTLTQTRVSVTPASLEFLLKSCGRVLSAATEDRLARAEDPALPSHAMWLKVAHVACLFGQRDVLRALWLRCRGGCSYAAQITTNGLHALELLSEPYEPALVAIMNRCAALREYLLWARIMQSLAVKGAVDEAEATLLCAELRQTGSWVGVWSEALLAYVKGNRERCVELCDELLRDVAAAGLPPPLVDDETNVAAQPRPEVVCNGTSSVVSVESAVVGTITPRQSSTPPPPPPPAQPLSQVPTSAPAAGATIITTATAATNAAKSMRPPMDEKHLRGLRELALRPTSPPLPRLEATAEEAPTTPLIAHEVVTREGQAGKVVSGMMDGKGRATPCFPLRRLPFRLVRRILLYCDAYTLACVHKATAMPLLQWISLARMKCLPAAQWTRLLKSNAGYTALVQSLCRYVAPPARTREEKEAGSAVEGGLLSSKQELQENTEMQAGAAVTMACPPFQPLQLSVTDVEDLRHFTIKATTLSHRAAPDSGAPAEPLTVGQWLLQSLFGRATSLVEESKYLVLSRIYRLSARDAEANMMMSADVSSWEWEVIRPWEVDINATIRWCAYVRQHAEAHKLL